MNTPPEASLTSPSRQSVAVPVNSIALPAELAVPDHATGLAICMRAAGCVRETQRVEILARMIQGAGVATLSFCPLTATEEMDDRRNGDFSYDLALMSHRLMHVATWAMQDSRTRALGLGFMGTSTLAAAALAAAASLGYAVQAVVSRAGRPDLMAEVLPRVTAPTLLVVGELDRTLVELNRGAMAKLGCPSELRLVEGASHLFEEPGALEQLGAWAADWFQRHLRPIQWR